jgi:hypothetical protein
MATNFFQNNPTADGLSGGNYFQIGRVKSVVMGPYKGGSDEIDPDYESPFDIGKIRYQVLYSNFNTSFAEETTQPAYPIFNFIKQYPLINEIVLIIAGPTERLNDKITNQQFYYFPAYNIWNSPNHGAFPNMQEYQNFLSTFSNQPQYSGNPTKQPSLPLGYTFTENPDSVTLQPFEGDTIIEARFGQSIRFGSTTVQELQDFNSWSVTGSVGDPITIIVNKLGPSKSINKFDSSVEDINNDGASIYLTSTQTIALQDINQFPRKSFRESEQEVISKPLIKTFPRPLSNDVRSADQQDKDSSQNYRTV